MKTPLQKAITYRAQKKAEYVKIIKTKGIYKKIKQNSDDDLVYDLFEAWGAWQSASDMVDFVKEAQISRKK